MESVDRLQAIAENALKDPNFLRRLFEDPVGTSQEAGLGFTPTREELKEMFAMSDSSDEEMIAALKERKSKSTLLTFVSPDCFKTTQG